MVSDTNHDSPADPGDAPTRRADEDELPTDATAPDPDHPGRHSIGDVIGERYRVESVLGQGAMGTVYLAEHTAMRKTVAIKSLHRRFTRRDEYLERFRREAQAAANIDHPNICQATDFIDARVDTSDPDAPADLQGPVYLVMEYLQGRTLTEVIDADGPLAPDRALELTRQMLDGLAAAHDNDVVHRDLKPDNIMLVVNDEADGPLIKLMDFGIARVRMDDDAETLTRAGEVYGTPHYMSPEQAAGDAIDRRTDLYATGVILYEMLAGRPPFDADKMTKVISKHITDSPEPVGSASPYRLSDALSSFVDRLMAKDADDRFTDADAARRRLDDLDPVARSTSTLNRISESIRAVLGSDEAGADQPPSESVADRLKQSLNSEKIGRIGHSIGDATGRATRLLSKTASQLTADYHALSDEARTTIRRTVAIAVTLAVVTTAALTYYMALPDAPAPEPIADQLSDARQSFASNHDIDLGDNGELDRMEAAGVLDDLDGAPHTAHTAYLRGRAHAMRGERDEALQAYRTALDADSSYAAVDPLLDDLVDFSQRDDDLGQRATSLLSSYMGDRFLLGHLGHMAAFADSNRQQESAYQLLTDHGGLGELPAWLRTSIDMRRASNCDGWQTHIDELAAIGDPRGARILEWYADKPPRGCGFLKTKDCYSCIRDRLPTAVDHLK